VVAKRKVMRPLVVLVFVTACTPELVDEPTTVSDTSVRDW
jgi:hypothetical protein